MSIRLSAITATHGATRKSFHLKEGKLIKKSGGQISRGFFSDLKLGSLEELPSLLQGMADDRVLCLGVCDREGEQKLFTKSELAKRGNQPGEMARTKDFIHWPDARKLAMLDIDPDAEGMAASWEHLISAVPEFAGVGRVEEHASSSFIYGTGGTEYKGEGSRHIYLVIAGDIAALVEWLEIRFWALGLGRWVLGKANAESGTSSLLERFPIDMAVFSPERLIFTAPPKLGAGLVQRRPAPQYHPGDVLEVAALPTHSEELRTLAEANKSAARAAAADLRLESATEHIAKTKGMEPKQARKAAKQALEACDNGVLERSHKLYLADGTCVLAGELDEEKHDGLLLRDPQEPTYDSGRCCAKIFCGREGIRIKSFAHGGKLYKIEPVSLPQSQSTAAELLNERYLPALELPSDGGILAIDSAMGTGKTEALEGLLTQFQRQHPDGKDDLIGYRNGLLTQTCERINQKGRVSITHKHEMRSLIRWDSPSMAYCVNSLDSRIHHLHAAIDAGQKVLIALDEVDFVIRHALDMMRSQPGTGLEFARLIQRVGQGNGYILAMQADLQDLPLALLRELCGEGFPINLMKNEYQGQPWNIKIVTPVGKSGKPSNGLSSLGAAEMAIASIEAGEFPLIVTTGQEWLETLTKAVSAKILRCDRYTVAAARAAGKAASREQKILLDLFKNPQRAIAAAKKLGVQAIGLTPTAETGISIDGVEFGRIIGYFPALTSESAIQLLGRDRNPNTPRYIFAADRAAGAKEGEGIYPEQILKNWKLNARKGFEIAKVREALSPEELQALDDEPDPLLDILARFAARYQARENADKLHLHANIAARLEAAGHTVQRSTVPISEGFREHWQAAKVAIAQRNYQVFAQSEATSVPDAFEVLRSGVGTRKQVYAARKTLILENYPGLDLDTPETVGRLVFERRGAALKEYTQAWLLKYPSVAAEIDRACWKAHLGEKIIWQPAIKREAYKAQSLADIGILALLKMEEYCESSPEVEATRAYCLKNAAELRRTLGYTNAFGEAHSGIKMVDWLLRRLGYAQRRVRRCGSRGEQISYWAVVDQNPSDRAAVEAALSLKWAETLRDKDSESGRSHLGSPNLLREMGSTALELPPIQGRGLVKWGSRLGDWVIESITGDVAKVRQATGYASRLVWDAPLSELREAAA